MQDDLKQLFRHLAEQRKPAAVVMIETIGSDHDLETEKDSLIYGREMSFSHNYPHLLQHAGFEIIHHVAPNAVLRQSLVSAATVPFLLINRAVQLLVGWE